MKTYILKYDIYNNIDFPKGTIISITDDYWRKGHNDLNTGFTVVSGKLKGEKGCVSAGLNGYLFDNTIENKKLIKNYKSEIKMINRSLKELDKKFDSLPTVKLN